MTENENVSNKASKSSSNDSSGGEVVRVVYVRRQRAKYVKNRLEADGKINRDFRMCAAAEIAAPGNGMQDDTTVLNNDPDLVAIPIICDTLDEEGIRTDSCEGVHHFGNQYCPYSSALLGNGNRNRRRLIGCGEGEEEQSQLNVVQATLVRAICFFADNRAEVSFSVSDLMEKVTLLSKEICPTKLELFGDDRTVVVPTNAFRDSTAPSKKMRRNSSDSFLSFLNYLDMFKVPYEVFTRDFLWKEIAQTYKSRRVVRRGEIDPDSPVRKGTFEILWVAPSLHSTNKFGPDSKYWITVTEQGIRQSFDMTRVMFSRGNISEKIRFGKLVQEDEIVLDMYAGIGYFTLPALVHGKAAHVYCCEWNSDAIEALRYNLYRNHCNHRATIMEGDCRELILERCLFNMFDRICLGILPSSEGGWGTAVAALRIDKGGWLHVHGNVPNREVQQWAVWLCARLKKYAMDYKDGAHEWLTIVAHIEEVKSFAPNVSHYVADVFLGPRDSFLNRKPHPRWIGREIATLTPGTAGILNSDGRFQVFDSLDVSSITPPSCALSPDGVLHQAWMRSCMEQDE
jgi:16S rRNA G966 N2-methylase RsmD